MREWKSKNKDKVNEINRKVKAKRPGMYRKINLESYHRTAEARWAKIILNSIKGRCARKGIPFDMSEQDISIPATCPVLGIPVAMQDGGFKDGSPSVDRLIPSKGYVRGNIRVISYRANAIKRDASLEELEAIVAYLKRELT